MNYTLLLATAAVFLLLAVRGEGVWLVVERHGFVNAAFTEALQDGERLLASLQHAVTSLFLHSGWLHVVGNLIFLRVFGDNVEDRFGHVGFLMFYLLGGLAGVGAHYYGDPTDTLPLIGASGAIAAVLGAYIVMFPTARVVTLFPVFIFLTFIEVPAVVFLGVWVAQQFLSGYFQLQDGLHGGVAWFAHLGGFAFGVLCGGVYTLTAGHRRRRAVEAA